LHFNSVMIIDDDETDLWITERLLTNNVIVEKVYTEKKRAKGLKTHKRNTKQKRPPRNYPIGHEDARLRRVCISKRICKIPKTDNHSLQHIDIKRLFSIGTGTD